MKYSLARSDGQAAIEVLQSGLSTNQKDATILEEKTLQIDNEIVKLHRLSELERSSKALRVKS